MTTDDLLATVAGLVTLSERMKSIELTEKVSELQAMCIQHVQEKAGMWSELQRLRQHIEVRDEMRLAHGAFWRGEAGESGDGPFCPRCWQADGKLMSMLLRPTTYSICPQCKTSTQLPWNKSSTPHRVQYRRSAVPWIDRWR